LDILTEWLGFRADTVRKKLNFRLDRIVNRLHILEGLLMAFLHIDAVIKIIRTADHPKNELIKTFSLTDIQASAILEIRLRQLARLEEISIKSEKKELESQKKELEKILGCEKTFKSYIKNEIKSDAKKYGDKRRSPIKKRKEAEKFSITDVMEVTPVTIILSKNGWIRSAKGHDISPESVKYKSGDSFLSHLRTKSDKSIIFLDNTGRSYTLPAHSLPSARGNGEPLTGHLTLPPNAHINFMLTGETDHHFLIGSDNGYGFIIGFSDFLTNFKNGKSVVSLKPNHHLLSPDKVIDLKSDRIAAVTTSGRLLIFSLDQLPNLKKGKGNKIISIPKKQLMAQEPERLKFLKILPLGANLVIYSGKHSFKLSPGNQKDYTGMRGHRGKNLPRGYQRVDKVDIIPIESNHI
jgi:topoisomerase-4 subunit A